MIRRLLILTACTILGLTGCASLTREKTPPVSPEQIVEMTKAGVAPADIIGKIQQSGTVYRLTASQFAQLSKEGVADAVLDYMQQTYIQEVARMARREAYDDMWFYGRSWYGYPWFGYPGIFMYR